MKMMTKKFRAWVLSNCYQRLGNKIVFEKNKMYYDVPPFDNYSFAAITEGLFNTTRDKVVAFKPRIVEAIIMAYTGIDDINGKEIYEYDIVNYKNNREFGIVTFKDGCFGVDFYDYNSDTPLFFTFYELIHNKAKFKVFGNIFENKELIPNFALKNYIEG
jgi:uncharacterized phage protein (TIGR01671 family)